jgi:hypothetical protein
MWGFFQTARRYKPDDRHFHRQSCVNLKTTTRVFTVEYRQFLPKAE